MDKTYTVEEVADLLHVNQDTVRRYIREGKIKASAPGGRKYVITEDQVYSLLNHSESYADVAATILTQEEGRLVSEFRTLNKEKQEKALNYTEELYREETCENCEHYNPEYQECGLYGWSDGPACENWIPLD